MYSFEKNGHFYYISDIRLRFMSTSAVLEATLNRNATFFHFTTDYSTLIKAWEQNSNEFRELVKREDAAEILFNCYLQEKPYQRPESGYLFSVEEEAEFNRHQSRLEELEFLLSLDCFQNQLSEVQRNMLPQLVKEKLILKRNHLDQSHVSWYRIKEDGSIEIPDMSYLYLSAKNVKSQNNQKRQISHENGWRKFYDKIYKKSSKFSTGSFDNRLHCYDSFICRGKSN